MSDFPHAKFLIDNNEIDFITELFTNLISFECDLIYDEIISKYILEI